MTKRKIETISEGFNYGFSKTPADAKKSRGANKRADGELYKRPVPNPGTPEWGDGYDDGIEGKSYNPLPPVVTLRTTATATKLVWPTVT